MEKLETLAPDPKSGHHHEDQAGVVKKRMIVVLSDLFDRIDLTAPLNPEDVILKKDLCRHIWQ